MWDLRELILLIVSVSTVKDFRTKIVNQIIDITHKNPTGIKPAINNIINTKLKPPVILVIELTLFII